MGKLSDPESRVEKSDDDRPVSKAGRCGDIYHPEESLQLRLGEGGGGLLWRLGDLDPREGGAFHYFFQDKPGPEGANSPQITIDGMARKPFVLRLGARVISKRPCLLEIQDKAPHLMGGDLGDVC